MKQSFLKGLDSIQRPVALMLAFLPIGSVAVAYGLVQWTRLMVIHEPMVDPNVAEILTGFGTLFREYAIPVLLLTVALAVLNVLAAFTVRPRTGSPS